MLPVRSHDHHAAVWAHHAEYERRLHSLLDALLNALPKNVADAFGQFIHFLVLPGKTPEVFGLIHRVARTAALRRAFLHLRFCMLAARTIENKYLRNPFDVRDGADKIHGLSTMAHGRCGSLILHESHSKFVRRSSTNIVT
jgi:hypothetical protein